ncbi:helix-turn-helix transcriptional regulator [candidate division WOR-3 bacterium]|uniref:Helix-turn-helix transcriptional regulator n=1 Tax=candidate division WOR-3 bacterium TaxID=2052148 RepID=A0A938BTF1_UNCW3|nr:helix-turn-helix transcriptional regulator [candidate division WOR-3 bacterium]
MQPASNWLSDSSLLTKEVGVRLRLLREQAGLSQEAVAVMLGLEPTTGKAQVSKIETGHYRYGPGLVRLLDFLRACGCGVDAVLDILDRHTSRETVVEERATADVLKAIETLPPKSGRRAFYYHVGLSHKAELRLANSAAARERVRRALARAGAESRELRLKREFNYLLNKMHIGWADPSGIGLRSYGRKVFATLRRLRKARPDRRQRALDRLDEWPVRMGLDPTQARRVKQAMMKLFERMVRSGSVD